MKLTTRATGLTQVQRRLVMTTVFESASFHPLIDAIMWCIIMEEVMLMRTTVTIDDQLLQQLLATTHSRNQSQAIRTAIAGYVRQQTISALDRFRGKVRLDRRILRWRHAQR